MVSLTILGVGLLAGLIATWVTLSRNHASPVEADLSKHWLVNKVAHRPHLAEFVTRRLDRTTAGGLLLTIGLGAIFALALVAGLLFDMVDRQYGFAEFDESVAEWGFNNATGTTYDLLHLFTTLGGTTVVVILTIVVGAYGWWRYKNWHVALFMVAVTAGQSLLNNGLKLLVDRDRPEIGQLAGWAGQSFPSGHSAAAAATYAAVALVLGLGAKRWIRTGLVAGAFFIAAGVGATRALLGAHWITDVVAGLSVGWAWFVVCAVAFGGRFMRLGEPKDEVAAATRNTQTTSVGST